MRTTAGDPLPPRRALSGGFTLLEVMAALAVMAVALSVLLVERNRAVQRTVRTNQRRAALQLAKTKMSEIVAGIETDTGGAFEDLPGYSWTATEEADEVVRPGGASYLRKITVAVKFEIRGGEDSVRLETSLRR